MKIAIVIGGANNVWDEYKRTIAFLSPLMMQNENLNWETFVTNDSIPLFPDWIDHAVTLHPLKLAAWAHKRNERGLNVPPHVWAHLKAKLVTDHMEDWGGSSGLFACAIALRLGFTRIILCGVPMDASYKHILRTSDWVASRAFLRGWQTHMNLVQEKVKSWSGWTRHQLGEPTTEWLRAAEPRNNAIA